MEYQDNFPDERQKSLIQLFPDCHLHIRGVAGSGKTRIAIAKYEYLLQKGIPEENVLFLAYNNALMNYVNDFLGKPVAKTYHKFIQPYLYPNPAIHILSNDDCRLVLITRAMNACQKDGKIPFCKNHDEAFFLDEINFINDFCLSKPEYLDEHTKRHGRPRISLDNRKICFKIYEIYNELKAAKGYQYDWGETAKAACKKLLQGEIRPAKKYDYIIIDEAQDFSFSMLKSLTYFLSNPSRGFILFSDLAQQIYGKRISFKSLNIGKFYRPRRLMVNYRNPQCIQKFAHAITQSKFWQGQVGKIDENSNATPDGMDPIYICLATKDRNQQLFKLVDFVHRKDPGATIGVAVYLKTQDHHFTEFLDVDTVYKILSDGGERVQNLNIYRHGFDSSIPISVGTFHSMKGLEFDYVFMIIPDNKVVIQFTTDMDVVRKKEEDFVKLCYMVSTRAKKRLFMIWQSDGEDAVPEAFSRTQKYGRYDFNDFFPET
ncbi:UvrD-helicase domain-containing protein [Megasphaera elsdenii]|uniref:UvrD-helicase domain-containing protein n=1 Tax=Megasphaera elsdenii TaxID=907 RepID=UPI0005130D81|nr:UvrD-helicase domain-containing protein [Megasphaera elsdenii]KGI89648.1 hypothetical protein JY94_04220 [Megasphaera elsdenii]